ncbi:MAG: hypothetical protein WAL22_23195 [Solirubrobacteraceae bacterium]
MSFVAEEIASQPALWSEAAAAAREGTGHATGARLVAPSSDPMAELVRAQRLAVALAESRGLDPDQRRHLSRSVVLDEDGR